MESKICGKKTFKNHIGTFVCNFDYRLICDTNSIKRYADMQFQEKNRAKLCR